MTQHERVVKVRVVPRYDVDTLGAPFKVTLVESVTLSVDPKTGDERVEIPDVVGLINAVVRSRVLHTRKLSGAEIKFIRNALGVRAYLLAEFLEMTPEHLSRCEAGAKVMSSASEKDFRLFAFLGTFYEEPEDILTGAFESEEIGEQPNAKQKKMVQGFIRAFLTMKIQSVYNAEEELHFELCRKPPVRGTDMPRGGSPDDDEWSYEPVLDEVA